MAYATIIDGTRHVRLDEIDPAADGGLTRAEAEERLAPLSSELRELQELMYAAKTHAVLVILQGMDAAGKDVTIQNVFATATPEAIRVRHFDPMTEEDARHDFLWRAHVPAPARGELVIFDRSYYEQVVMPQIEGEATPESTRERAEDVLAFERILGRGGAVVVKFFLHVSPDEQERRLRKRMDDPETAWKVSARDWTSRRSWETYMEAYETAMNATASAETPWYVVPADHEWFHDLAVADALVERMRAHRSAWMDARDRRGREGRAEVREQAPEAFDASR